MATLSMTAHATMLLDTADRWATGTRKADGLVITLFTGSQGQTYLASERGCTCKSYLYRGQCAHVLAITLRAEQARAAAVRPKVRYEDLDLTDDVF